jgi:NADPH-dependent 2,4-dienoyl-CoA reductase/sulfur reductase-like enzyme
MFFHECNGCTLNDCDPGLTWKAVYELALCYTDWLILLPRRKGYDVLVIGSGASGGWVAKELPERRPTVAMLEEGPPRVPTRDFTAAPLNIQRLLYASLEL